MSKISNILSDKLDFNCLIFPKNYDKTMKRVDFDKWLSEQEKLNKIKQNTNQR